MCATTYSCSGSCSATDIWTYLGSKKRRIDRRNNLVFCRLMAKLFSAVRLPPSAFLRSFCMRVCDSPWCMEQPQDVFAQASSSQFSWNPFGGMVLISISVKRDFWMIYHAQGQTDTETNFVVTVGFTTKVDHQTTSKIWFHLEIWVEATATKFWIRNYFWSFVLVIEIEIMLEELHFCRSLKKSTLAKWLKLQKE